MLKKIFNLILLIGMLYSVQTTSNKNPVILNESLEPACPYDISCECFEDNDCHNQNCKKTPKGSYCFPRTGDAFPNFTSFNQFNEIFSLHDLSNKGKFVLIEMAADWCSPCHMLSNWLTFANNEIKEQVWWKDEYNIIYDLVHNNDVYFITVLYEDEFRNNATYDTVVEWYSNYPEDKIQILADADKKLHTWLKPSGIPAITLVDENMNILAYTNRGLNVAFDSLLSTFGDTKND